jgi:RNA polymerase sigma-70 factor, ECF subfamily
MSSSGQSLAGEYGSAVDDTVLVREAQNGNVKAFEELARHYDQAVLGLALHLTGSREAAQDMYQDVFLCAYQNLPHFRFECSFYTWLYRIVTKVGLDRLRRNQLQSLDVSEEVSTGGADEEPVAQTPDLQEGTCHEQSSTGHGVRQKIGRALSRLSARERMVFELKHYQGLKLHTVATLLNTTENIVKSTLLRATQKLRLAASEGAETL